MEIDEIIEEMRYRPHTYSTILGELKDNNTEQRKIRRKLIERCRFGEVYRCLINIYELVFYHPEKEYTLFFEQHYLGVNTYYCKDYSEDRLFVHLKCAYKLKDKEFLSIGDITIDKENLLRVA